MADVEFKRVALSLDRWMLLMRFLHECQSPEGPTAARPTVEQATVVAPVEIEGVTFLPAVYYPA